MMTEQVLLGADYAFVGIDMKSWLSANDERERFGLDQRDCRRAEMCGSIRAHNLRPRCMRMAFRLGQISIYSGQSEAVGYPLSMVVDRLPAPPSLHPIT